MSKIKIELPVVVEVPGRDRLELRSLENDSYSFHFVGCEELSERIKKFKTQFGNDLLKWPEPEETSHASLLLREFLLKIKGEWKHPFPAGELCHCRLVPVEVVDQAIISGAHTSEVVSRWTSASTACGTCRSDVEKILNFRLGFSRSNAS